MSQKTLTDDTRPGAVEAQPSASAKRWWILAVVALAQLMVVLDATIVNIALPSAQADLGFSDGNRQWIVTAYALAFALPAAARRPDRRPVRPQDGLPRRRRRLRRRLRARRRRQQLRDAGHRPRPAGRLRRAARPGRALAAQHDLHRRPGARQGVQRLRRHRRRRRRGGPAARRRADRRARLALDAVRQRASSPSSPSRAAGCCCTNHRDAANSKLDVPGTVAGRRRSVLARLRLLQRGDARLGFARDLGLPDRRRCAAGRLRLVADPGRPPAAAAAHPAGPQPRGLVPRRADLRRAACSVSSSSSPTTCS